jgi:hypothetical protein
MTPAALLDKLRSAGIALFVAEGRLRYRAAAGVYTAELRQQVAAHKPALIALLVPPWDQTEADALLDGLRSQVEYVRRKDFAGTLPAELANVLADAVAIGEDLVARHEKEAANGWDVLGMLRGLQGHVVRCVTNWQQIRPGITTWRR